MFFCFLGRGLVTEGDCDILSIPLHRLPPHCFSFVFILQSAFRFWSEKNTSNAGQYSLALNEEAWGSMSTASPRFPKTCSMSSCRTCAGSNSSKILWGRPEQGAATIYHDPKMQGDSSSELLRMIQLNVWTLEDSVVHEFWWKNMITSNWVTLLINYYFLVLTCFRQAQISCMSSACVPGSLDQESILDPWQPTARCAHSATYIPSRPVSERFKQLRRWKKRHEKPTCHCLPSGFWQVLIAVVQLEYLFKAYSAVVLFDKFDSPTAKMQTVSCKGGRTRLEKDLGWVRLGLMWRFLSSHFNMGVTQRYDWFSQRVSSEYRGVIISAGFPSCFPPSIICIGNCTHSCIWISQSTPACPYVLPFSTMSYRKPSNTLPKRVKTRDPILQHRILWHFMTLIQFLRNCHWQNVDEGRVILSIRVVPGYFEYFPYFFLEDDFFAGIIFSPFWTCFLFSLLLCFSAFLPFFAWLLLHCSASLLFSACLLLKPR